MDKGELDAAIESFKQASRLNQTMLFHITTRNVQIEKGDPEAAIES